MFDLRRLAELLQINKQLREGQHADEYKKAFDTWASISRFLVSLKKPIDDQEEQKEESGSELAPDIQRCPLVGMVEEECFTCLPSSLARAESLLDSYFDTSDNSADTADFSSCSGKSLEDGRKSALILRSLLQHVEAMTDPKHIASLETELEKAMHMLLSNIIGIKTHEQDNGGGDHDSEESGNAVARVTFDELLQRVAPSFDNPEAKAEELQQQGDHQQDVTFSDIIEDLEGIARFQEELETYLQTQDFRILSEEHRNALEAVLVSSLGSCQESKQAETFDESLQFQEHVVKLQEWALKFPELEAKRSKLVQGESQVQQDIRQVSIRLIGRLRQMKQQMEQTRTRIIQLRSMSYQFSAIRQLQKSFRLRMSHKLVRELRKSLFLQVSLQMLVHEEGNPTLQQNFDAEMDSATILLGLFEQDGESNFSIQLRQTYFVHHANVPHWINIFNELKKTKSWFAENGFSHFRSFFLEYPWATFKVVLDKLNSIKATSVWNKEAKHPFDSLQITLDKLKEEIDSGLAVMGDAFCVMFLRYEQRFRYNRAVIVGTHRQDEDYIVVDKIKVNIKPLKEHPSKRSHVLTDAKDMNRDSDVVVKAFCSLESAQAEFRHLKALKMEGDPLVVSTVRNEVMEGFYESEGVLFHGVAIEKGICDVNVWVIDEGDLTFEERHKIGKELIDIVTHIHDRGFVWNDCKLSNFVQFKISRTRFKAKAIDLEHATPQGSVMHERNVGFTPRYTSPEVIRHFYDHGEEKKEEDRSLTASYDFDMWSLGVCLLKLHTGKDLADHLNLQEEDVEDAAVGCGEGRRRTAIVDFYLQHSNEYIQDRINSVITQEFSDRKYRYVRSLVSKLLTTNVVRDELLEQDIDERVRDLFGDRGSSLKETLLQASRLDLSNDENLVSSLKRYISSMLPSPESMNVKELLQSIVELRQSRRISITQTLSHAYYTNQEGTTTVSGRRTDSRMKDILMSIQNQLQELNVAVDDIRDDLETVIENQVNIRQQAESLRDELADMTDDNLLSEEDESGFIRLRKRLKRVTDEEELTIIKDQLQEIYDRVTS